MDTTHSTVTQPASRAAERPPRSYRVAIAVGVIVTGMIVAGVVPRIARRQALDRTQAEASAPRRVTVAPARLGQAKAEISLPGTAAPMQSVVLYARTSGFVSRTLVDLGDRVKEGQLLAELESPEVEEDLRRVRARLEEAQLNVGLARDASERQSRLAQDGVTSRQQADDARGRANSAQATLETARAELQRLNALLGFRRVVAPFDGTITRRNVDRGALVTAGSGAGVTSLFELAQTDVLKVSVDVPQSLAADIKPGMEARVSAAGGAQREGVGKVERTAGALDPATRTLRTEVHLPGDGALLAGAYVLVRFTVERSAPPVVVPASALVLRKDGPQVVRVQADSTVRYQSIQLGRDLGKEVEVLSGVSAGDRVVLNPPDDLADAQPVRVAEAAARGK